jgi:hypothetical protein
MASFPLTLPQYPLLAGLSFSPPSQVLRSTPKYGKPLARRLARYGMMPVRCGQKFPGDTERATLLTFFDSDCAGGAIPFTWPQLSAVTGGGTGLFHWVEPPDFSPEGAQRWRVLYSLMREY